MPHGTLRATLEKRAGDDAEERKDGGRRYLEDRLRLGLPAFDHVVRIKGPVPVSDDVPLRRVGAGADRRVGRDAVMQKRVVAHEQNRRNGNERPLLAHEHIQRRGESPAERQELEHAHHPEIRFEVQDAIERQPDEEEKSGPGEYLQQDAPRGTALRLLRREGERPGDAHQEEEERQDGVVLREALPPYMTHLRCEPALGAAKHLAESQDHRRATGDEEHVEAPQRVERRQSFSLRNFFGFRFLVHYYFLHEISHFFECRILCHVPVIAVSGSTLQRDAVPLRSARKAESARPADAAPSG